MKKKWSRLLIISLSMMALSACGTNNENEGATSEATQSESMVSESAISETTSSQVADSSIKESEEVSLQEKYNKMYTDGSDQYHAGKYDEAAGTIELLLQNDLSEYSDIETKATSLKEQITLAQAEEAKASEATALIENSAYKTERTSDLAAAEFAEATGKDIKTVSDDEISSWLSDKEAATAESSNATTEATPEEEMTTVLDAVVSITGISPEDNQFYATKTNEQTYTVEIRHSHEVDGVGISNMVGMFEYNLATKELKKMDPLTGEYSVVTE